MENTTTTNRVVVYLQSQENLNVLPSCFDTLTAINVSSFHFGFNQDSSAYIHLNDHDPNDSVFDSLWSYMKQAQQKNVKVIAMLGGAGGAYTKLFEKYETFYPLFVKMLKNYQFDGVDLDVEEAVTIESIKKLINDLRRDFPTNFLITSAPVCSSLQNGIDHFAGINWADVKNEIDWFNVQFYSGFGSLSSVNDYNKIINAGYDSNQILSGLLTNPKDGVGYVDINIVCKTLETLRATYGSEFGGAMGWEFYNANNIQERVDPEGWVNSMKLAVQG